MRQAQQLPSTAAGSPRPGESAAAHTPNLTRALILLLLLFIVPLMLAGVWIHTRAEREIEQAELQRDRLRARTLAAVVEREFVTTEKILTSVAERRSFQQAWQARDLKGLEQHFRDILELEPAFLFASVYETDGTLRAILPPDPIVGRNYNQRDWYRGVVAKWTPYVSEVYRTAAAPNPLVVAVAVPIHDAQSRPVGILMAAYALDQLTRKFEMLQAGTTGMPYVVDQRSHVAAAPGIDPGGEPMRAPLESLVARALAGQEGSGREVWQGEENLVGYAPVGTLGWAVVHRRPTAEALAAVERMRQQSLTVGLYLLLIYLSTAAVAAVLARRQTRSAAEKQALNQALEGRIDDLHLAQKRLAVQYATARALAESESLEEASLRILQAVCESLEWEHGAVWVVDAEADVLRCVETWHATSVDFPEFTALSRRTTFARGIGLPGRVWASGQPAWIEDVVRDTNFPRAPVAAKEGLHGAFGFPIVLGGETLGVMEFFSREIRQPDEELLKMMATIGSQIGQFLERRRAEQQLRAAKEEAERASRFKDQFLSMMSHELRTPLSAILGFSELLLDERYGALNERQRRYLQHIHTGGHHLLRLISDILDLSKIEAGRLELSIGDVAVRGILSEALDALRTLAEKKKQGLQDVVEDGLVVRADATRLRQVITNLVGNAIKFTPEDGQIRVTAKREDARVRFEVHDTGAGIPPEEQARIFEAFYQLRTSRAKEGTGLGLAITQRLVELQGGVLRVESEAGRGSCFWFTLPVAVEASKPASPATDGRGVRRVLVIENDAVTAKLIHAQLASAGYEATLCEQPERAVELAAELQPHAITLDIMMPPVNGFQVLRDLKADARTAAIPVLVMTVVDQPALGLALGADEYLVKPVDRARLLAAVARCLKQRGPQPVRPILIVEDDAGTREVVADLLSGAGYAVAAVADGAEARAWVQSSLPELVILDLVLPKMSGFELLAEWRADERTAGLPVFVLTGKDLSEKEEQYLRAQAELLLRKQIPWQTTLLQQLRRAIDGSPEAA